MIRTCLALLVACFAATSPALAENAVVTKAIEGFIRPAYTAFHAAASALRTDMDALCAAPSPAALARTQSGFGRTVDSWSAIEIFRFGPATEENRQERILFWPDRKGIALKQVQQALAEKDETAADPQQLAGKSVALQGLGTLEFLLYGTGSEALAAGDGYRCRFALAVSSNLEAMAEAMDQEWQRADGFAAQWENPAADNRLYHDDQESLTELLDVFVHGLEMVRDVRINGFLGKQPGDDRPRAAIFWRSGKTQDSIAANLAALHRLLDASGLADLLSNEERWIVESAGFEFANADKALAASAGPIAEILAEPDRRQKLDYVRIVTSSLSDIFGTRIAADLGLTAGFSSLDGD